MTNVLHINDYPIEAGGGAEVVMARTIALLRERGLAVETFTSADLADHTVRPLRYIDHAGARRALAAKLEAFRPEVVHLHNYYHVLSPGILGTLAEHKRRHRLHVVLSAHDYHLICPNSGGSWFRWWTGQRENIEPAALTLPMLLTRNWDQRGIAYSLLKLAQHGWNYRWHRRHAVIDCVICPSRFVERMLAPLPLATCWLPHPAPPRATTRPTRTGPLRFVFAGRIESEKGLNELFRIWPDDDASTFTIIGAGAELPACMAMCAQPRWRGRVEFAGRLPHAETLARIADCHVLVQPSRVLETFGLTLIEALAQGTNILAAQRGAAGEIVEATGVGFLYQPDDPRSLAEQVDAIRRQYDEGTLNRFDIARYLEEHSERRYVEKLLAIYGSGATRVPLAA
jgi:glycosyltransferase involved in cell wall biosynthesis